MVKTKVTVPLYGRKMCIVVTEDISDAIIEIEGYEYDESNKNSDLGNFEATVMESPNGLLTVLVKPNADVNTIAHESFHVAVTVLSDIGMKLSSKSEEAYAYLIGWVAEQINKALISYNK